MSGRGLLVTGVHLGRLIKNSAYLEKSVDCSCAGRCLPIYPVRTLEGASMHRFRLRYARVPLFPGVSVQPLGHQESCPVPSCTFIRLTLSFHCYAH